MIKRKITGRQKERKQKNGLQPTKASSEKLLAKGKKTTYPKLLQPMLATLIDKPFDEPGWIYEVKWDGYRAIAGINKGKVELISRNNKSFNEKFYPVSDALKKCNINAILDGEVVVLDEKGISNFGDLQNWRSEADGELYYFVFDILWLEGKSLVDLPLKERKVILYSLLKIKTARDIIRLSQSFEESGIHFFETSKKLGLEGIMAKKANSIYLPGDRSKEWLKIKANKRQEMVIGGYTNNEDSNKVFSALLVGVFRKNKLVYTGKVGTGFNAKMQNEMMIKFKKLIVNQAPFEYTPDVNKPSRFRPNPPRATVTWLRPKLVCEVSFTEMTTDGIMRHPSFEGLRTDKNATEVVLEKAKPARKTVQQAGKDHIDGMLVPVKNKERRTLLNPTEETQVKNIKGHELKFSNLSKIFWPREKVTKRDMINYYYQVAPYILPYLKGRPQSMNRHPNGINGKSFYYKDVTGNAPGWIDTFAYKSDTDNRVRNYLVASDEASLLYMANLGCIEMNPWHSTVERQHFPDWCIIDLDPAKNTFEQVIEAARVTKEILDSIGVASYPKTSGSTGIHIYIPLGAKYTYEQSKEFARVIAHLIHNEIPSFTSIERTVRDRKGKMYIDFLQNRPHATVSAPYSLRPKPGATVSMPLHWEEVKKGLKMTDFTIFNAIARIKGEDDIFKPVLGKGIKMNAALAAIEDVFHH